MYNHSAIHLMATLGKIVVDYTKCSDIKKELMKEGIDLIAIFLSELNDRQQNQQQKHVLDKKTIQTRAKANDLDKIVIFPYPLENGDNIVLIRMYGGNIQQFASSIGIILLDGYNSINSDVDYYERLYGKVLYQRA